MLSSWEELENDALLSLGFGLRSTGVVGISDLFTDAVLKKLETWGILPVCVLWPLITPSSTCD